MLEEKMSEENWALATQCLAFCQTLITKGKAFTFSLNIGSSFSFNLDTKVKNPYPLVARNKVSPSTKRSNTLRKKTFLESKKEKSTDIQLAEANDAHISCELSATSRKCLNIHMAKYHNKFEQLDGNISMNSTLVENTDEETNLEPESKTFELKFNPSKHFATGNIPKSHMRVTLPNPPTKRVLHEILGLGDFVTTHQFGQMGHIRKGTKR